MSLQRKRQCQTIGITATAVLLIASLAPLPLASLAQPPGDKPTTQPKDDDRNAGKDKDADDDRPPLGGPRGDRHRRFGPEGRPRGMDDGNPPDRPGNFGPREGRGPRPFRPDGEAQREGWRGMFPPRGEGDAQQPPIPPEVMQKLDDIIREEIPELHKRIIRWRENQPERYDRAMAKFYPSIREYLILREKEPALALEVLDEIRIEIQLRKLRNEYDPIAETDPRRAEIEKEFDARARKQVDIRLRRRAARIRFLEERLKLEKEKLAAEQSGVEDLYKKRLDEVKRGRIEEPFPRPGFQGPRGPGGPPSDDRD